MRAAGGAGGAPGAADMMQLMLRCLTIKKAKNKYFFKGVFSEAGVNKSAKKAIQKHYPSFYELIELTNSYDTPKLFPMILQKVESRILLDEISDDLFQTFNKNNMECPFYTVHDAVYIHPEFKEGGLKVIEKSFLDRDFDLPKFG